MIISLHTFLTHPGPPSQPTATGVPNATKNVKFLHYSTLKSIYNDNVNIRKIKLIQHSFYEIKSLTRAVGVPVG